MGGVGRDGGEVHFTARCQLGQARRVQGQRGTDFRVTADGLPVIEKDNGLPVGGYLDRALADSLGQDTLDIAFDSRALQPVSHAIAAIGHGIRVAEEPSLL